MNIADNDKRQRHFAVTGLGLITPLGNNVETNWTGLINGESAVEYDKETETFIARVQGFNMPSNQRQTAMAQTAIEEALKDAGLNAKDCGLVLGDGKPNLFNRQDSFSFPCHFEEAKTLENPALPPLRHCSASQLPSFPASPQSGIPAVSAACSTGTLAIIKACQLIKDKVFNAVICGCAETSLHPLYIASFKKMGVLSKNGHRPFDKNRDGFSIGEGAGFIIVENYDKALKRGAKIYCETAGFACGMFTDNIVNVNSSDKMSAIISRAANGQKPDFIHTHGTGTKLNDYYESKAVNSFFACHSDNPAFSRCRAAKPPSCQTSASSRCPTSRLPSFPASPLLSSTKAATGHLLSVSGMAGAVFSILSIKNGILPPTLNFSETDISFGLNYVANKKLIAPAVKSALSLSWGFGGQGAALYFKC